MNLLNPPELADGGYWYVVPAVTGPDIDGLNPGQVPGRGFGAWYASGLVVIRTPSAILGVENSSAKAAKEVLIASGYAAKPRCRIEGA